MSSLLMDGRYVFAHSSLIMLRQRSIQRRYDLRLNRPHAVFAFLVTLLFSPTVAANVLFQGRIVQSNGQGLESGFVQYTFEVRSPAPEDCLLYRETYNVNMTNSRGIFSLLLGGGAPTGPAIGLTEAFSPVGSYTGLTCGDGSTAWTSDPTDKRVLRVTAFDGVTTYTIADNSDVEEVPYAMHASTLGGIDKDGFIKVNASGASLTQANVEQVFSTTNFPELVALLNGTSTRYARSSDLPVSGGILNMTGGGVRVPNTPPTNDSAVNKNYSDGYIAGRRVDGTNLSGLANGESLRWDSTANSGAGGWVRYTPVSAGAVVNSVVGAGPIAVTGTTNVTVDLDYGNGLTVSGGTLQAQAGSGILVDGTGIRADVGTAAGQVMGAGAVPSCLPNEKLQMSAGPTFVWSCVADVTGSSSQWTTSGSNIYYNTGNVGIGTASPGSLMHVAGRLQAQELYVATPFLLNPAAPVVGIESRILLARDTSPHRVAGMYGWTNIVNSGNSTGEVVGVIGTAGINGSDYTQSVAIGVDGQTSLIASSASIVTRNVGVRGGTSTSSSTTSIEAMALLAAANQESGTGSITSSYGVYLEPQTAGVNNWQLYSAGTAPSYFAGNVGIGQTNPATALDVNGAVRVGTTATACASPVAGALRYNDGTMEYCNGTAWTAFSAGSSLPAAGGTAAAPGYAFSGDTDTGMYRPAANEIGFATNGTVRARINANGNLGLGQAPGTARLSLYQDDWLPMQVETNQDAYMKINGEYGSRQGLVLTPRENGGTVFQHVDSGTAQYTELRGGSSDVNANTLLMQIRHDGATAGFVGIGQGNPQVRLDVNGAVRVGTTATACAAPVAGAIRYNAGVVEYCNGTAWTALSSGGGTVAVANGGTGATTAADARTNLGLGTAAVANIGTGAGNVMAADGVPNCAANEKLQMSLGPTFAWSCVADQTGAGSQWTTSGSDIYFTAGNVGIGATNPTVPLTVRDAGATNGDSVGYFEQTATNAATDFRTALLLRNNGTGGAFELNLAGYNAAGLVTSAISQAGGAYFAGNVGIGEPNPAVSLDVNGAVRIGTTATACAAPIAGAVRYNAGVVQYCNGTAWISFSTGSSFLAASGTAAAPGFAFSDDTDTGIFGAAADQLGFATAGAERVRVDSTGNVGIGNSAPSSRVDVTGSIVSRSASITTGAIDFNSANAITTTFDCNSAVSFANLRDGGSYSLAVTSTNTSQCNFSTTTTGADAATVTYRYNPVNAPRASNSHTVYSLQRMGNTVYVSWISGF